MANEYYERLSEMNPGDLADGLAMEAEFDAISQGFSKLPTPHTGGQGFDGPVRVGDAVNTDEAVSLGQLNAAIGEAVLLPIATYGNLSATAWETLPSNTYLLFGTGAQLSNTPYTLVAGSTYYLQVRHVIGGAGVSIYHDQLSLTSSDDAGNVDLRRLFVRTGPTFANAKTGGWAGFTLKKAALTALESLTPTANQIAYYTGASTASLAVLSAFARTLIDDADSAAMLATLGAVGYIGVVSSQDWNTILTQGVYQVINFSGLNSPPAYSYGVLLVYTIGALTEQIYYPHRSNIGPACRRQSFDGGATWPEGWDGIYARKTILGAVAQSGGVPTGAIIERGSNANGSYTKLADGLMICVSNLLSPASAQLASSYSGFYGHAVTPAWTFPAAFSVSPRITPSQSFVSSSLFGVVPVTVNANTTTAHLQQYALSSRLAGHDLHAIAVGYWY